LEIPLGARDEEVAPIVEQPVQITRYGAMTLTTNDKDKNPDGTLLFIGRGYASFASLSSSLIINGNAYVLASNISGLAAAIAANESGHFALANNYNAQNDGTYSEPPLGNGFGGIFTGLGNTISNFTEAFVQTSSNGNSAGLFGYNEGNHSKAFDF
jgi:hypothetical protein